MSTGLKSRKSELIAIYRLEFYKKKKNWKFCQDVCKETDKKAEPKPPENDTPTPTAKNKSILNTTYNIAPQPELESQPASEFNSDFNNALLETDLEQNLPTTPSDPDLPIHSQTQPVYPQEPNAPGTAWVEPEKPCEEWDRGWSQDEPDALWKEREQAYIEDVYPAAGGHSAERLVANEWPVHSQVWSNDAYAGASWAAGDAGEGGRWSPEVALTAAERWLRGDQRDLIWTDCEESSWSASGAAGGAAVGVVGAADVAVGAVGAADGAGAFMRGAAAAPHSSELDLRDLSVSSGEGSVTLISGLSSRQLEARVSRHADQLRRLLAEARARDQQAPRGSQSLDYHTNYTLEDRPTHDTGPAPVTSPASLPRPHPPLLREATFSKDAFLAGSFKNSYSTEDLGGRGRGRLRRNIIGIGMGRPYRV